MNTRHVPSVSSGADFGGLSDNSNGASPLFYARCSTKTNFRDARRIVIQCPTAEDAREALVARGLNVHILIQAEIPVEAAFSYRPDGTILVGASKQKKRLRVIGPFNDETDARRWIAKQLQDLSYTVIEPDECLHYERIKGVLVEITFPDDLFSGPLGDT